MTSACATVVSNGKKVLNRTDYALTLFVKDRMKKKKLKTGATLYFEILEFFNVYKTWSKNKIIDKRS